MDKIEILGVRIDQSSLQETLSVIDAWLNSDGQHWIATVNPEFVVAAQKNQAFKQALNAADLTTCDGVGLVWAGKFLRQGKLTRVTGVDLSATLFSRPDNNKVFYLLGGKNDTAGKLAKKLRVEHDNIQIAGAESGGRLDDNYSLEDNDKVLERIKNSGANILLVAFGQVKQELWINNNLPLLPNIKAAIGVGGTFDYLLGTAKRPPRLVRRLGGEWLYRLITQPWRVKRIFNATIVFPGLVVLSKFKKQK